MTPLQLELDHLLQLASTPAWIEYAKWKAKAYSRQFPEDYADLEILLTEALSARTFSSTKAAGTPAGNCSTDGS